MSTTERDDLTEDAGVTRPLAPRPPDDDVVEETAGTEPDGVDPEESARSREERPGQPRSQRRRTLPPLTGGRVRRVVKRRMVVRKLDPWSVLKLSLIFYFSVLLIVMLGVTVLWAVVNQIGVIDTLLGFAAEVRLDVTYDAGNIARALFLIGLLNVVLFSGINVFLCFLYNLVADLIGGFRLTLAEEE